MAVELPKTLAEDEYLLKIRQKDRFYQNETGFLSKFNKDGSIPKNFENWPTYGHSNLPILIHKETFKKGWKILSWRFGMSQNWATMKHPDGFTLEIYLDDLLRIIQDCTIKNGTLQGEFKWEKNKLIKKVEKKSKEKDSHDLGGGYIGEALLSNE